MAAGICNLVLVGSLDTFVVLLTLGLASVNRLSIELLPAPSLAFLLLFHAGYVVVLTALRGLTIGKMDFGSRVVVRNVGLVSIGLPLVRAFHTMISWCFSGCS